MDGEDPKTSELRNAFRMREYEAVLDKITHARTDVARLETIYPFAIAAIYAWVFANPPALAFLWNVTLALPVAIALLGGVRLYSRRKHMTLLETYVRELEAEIYGDCTELGWERRYESANPLKGLILLRGFLAVAILVVTICIALNSDALFNELQVAKRTQGI